MPKKQINEGRYTLKKIPVEKLQKGPYQHELLAGSLVARIKAYKAILHEVEPTTLEEAMDDFLRDVHPEREIAIWEKIAESYQEQVNRNPSMTTQEKIILYATLLTSVA